MLSNFTALMVINWRITLIAAIPALSAMWMSKSLGKIYFERSRKVQQAASHQNARLQQLISGIGILRLLGRESAEREQYVEYSKKYTLSILKLARWHNGLSPLYGAVAGLGMVLVIGWGAAEVVQRHWTVGGFTAYFALFAAFSEGSFAVPDIIRTWYIAKAAWERIQEKLAAVPAGAGGLKTAGHGSGIPEKDQSSIKDQSAITVRNLTFKYPGMHQPLLENISFCLTEGQWLGVTGPVASGKSALGIALSGLYQYEGSISVNGTELRGIADEERARLFGYVGHDTFLFSGTIQDNILFGNPLDELRLGEVLAASALERDIPLFSKGLATTVGERGMQLSGGQRQRIALARALYTDAPIMLLDDPFSAIDTASEHRMVKGLRTWGRTRSLIVITHRLTALEDADRIIVLRKGRIYETGTHEELLASGGMYAQIYKAQICLKGEDI